MRGAAAPVRVARRLVANVAVGEKGRQHGRVSPGPEHGADGLGAAEEEGPVREGEGGGGRGEGGDEEGAVREGAAGAGEGFRLFVSAHVMLGLMVGLDKVG
jgi:hypothetical protein